MKPHEKALKVLSEELFKVGGKVFAEYYLRKHAEGETKKYVENATFLDAIMTGKGIFKEWKLEESTNFIEFQEIAKAMNVLNDDTPQPTP